MEPLRLLVVDDHILFRKGLVSLLASQDDIEVIGEADDGLEALEKTRELVPDIILMDISMPRCDGLEATRRIRAEMPFTKIVILTVSEAETDLFQAIASGAHGYLLKSLQPEELFGSIRGVRQSDFSICASMATKISTDFSQQFSEPAPLASLTLREREVLDLVVWGATNRDIASSLSITENTVKNHLKAILQKLHLQNRVQAAAYVYKQGIVTRRARPPIVGSKEPS